jgi:peptide/nickel transport system permease protein
MSSLPAEHVLEDATAVEATSAPRRGFMARVMSDAFRRMGARVGAVWIAIVTIGAVFAPFIASSHPYVMRENGKLSFPLFRNLHPVDIVLPAAGIAALVLLLKRKLSLGKSLALLLWVSAVVGAATTWPSFPSYFHDSLMDLFGRAFAWIFIVAFALALIATIIIVPFFLNRRTVLITGACLLPLVVWVLIFPVRPPVTVVYSKYREDTQDKLIQWAIYAPIPFSPSDRMNDLGDTSFQPPSRAHWMGTEYNGADVFSRMIHACRIALAIGLISTGIARLIGVLIGGVMGYFVGRIDIVGMRLIEIFEAIPTLFLLITFVAFYGRNLYAMMVIIGITGWTSTARFIRAEFLKIRTQDFVQAAIASGLPLRSVLFKHMLPNGITPVLVTTSFGIASAILYESTLSFLGLGLIDEPSWGQILNQARGVGASFVWWIAIYPGGAIFLTVLAYNLIGESLRDALDPKLRKAE